MKNIIYLLILAVFISSCEEDETVFSNSDAFVRLVKSTSTVEETGKLLKVVVGVSDMSRSGDVTVDFEIATDGIDNKAIEGTDFILQNTEKKLTFKQGQYTDTIFIKTIDNGVYTKNKYFDIVLKSNNSGYKMGLGKSTIGLVNRVKIIDNEHPLALILGVYTQNDFKLSDGSAAGTQTIEILSDPNNDSKVIVRNFWNGGKVISANVDIANKTIEFPKGQVIYVHGTYGNCSMVAVVGAALDKNVPILGTISDNGNITIGAWAANVAAGNFGVYGKSELIKK